MKRKLLVPVIVIFTLLPACSCPLTSLPFSSATSTPAIQEPSFPPTTTPAPVSTAPIPSSAQPPFTFAWEDRTPFQKDLSSSAKGVLSGLTGASVYHIAFNISDPPTNIAGIEEIRYTNTETVDLSEVDFAVFSEILGGSIVINSFSIDGQPKHPSHQNGIMRVALDSPLKIGSSLTFHIEFQVTVPTQGGNFYYGIFGYNDSILSLAHAYPTILVYDDQGWNNQPPDLDGDPLFSDTSLYLVSVDAPASLTLAASGVELTRSTSAGRQHVLYADGPARDFYLAASADFQKKSQVSNGVTINSYTLTRQSAYAQAALDSAKAAVADFSQRYAPYPYTEFDIVPIVTEAGGVEFPGIVAISTDVYGAGHFQEIVVVHETGHQWFYNLVGDETQRQPWLDESFAEFLTWQYYLDQDGTQAADEYKSEMKSTWDSLNDQPIPIGQPVSSYTSEGYVAIVYGRGPLFIIALRQQMGTAKFDAFMKDYVGQFSWKIATTAAFEQLADQDCGCNLDGLFRQWVLP